MNFLESERQKYVDVWSLDAYAAYSPGEAYLPLFLDMIGTERGTILDAGCGSGKGALALHEAKFNVSLCDLTDAGLVQEARFLPFTQACLWNRLAPQLPYRFGGKFDWVYCCDVLEHIPTPFTMLVISRLLEISKRGVFLSISLMPDQFGVWIGKTLHQTVQPFNAWKQQLNTVGRVKESRDLLHCGVFLVESNAK